MEKIDVKNPVLKFLPSDYRKLVMKYDHELFYDLEELDDDEKQQYIFFYNMKNYYFYYYKIVRKI